MKKKFVILFLSFCIGINAFSQVTITGNVMDKQQKVVSNVFVTLGFVSDSSVISYTKTNDAGDYKLTYAGDEPELLLSISSLGMKKQTKRISRLTQSVNFITEEGGVALKEVVVKSQKIWGKKDTINYNVSSFKDKNDVVIEDVLKKMPGINVAENGQIKYKGKPINKFYIENMDLLQGRYAIATKNISANDISTVQILEHHQPVKALEKIENSENAAINLKIKEGKKGIFTLRGTLALGCDTSLLWHGELAGMYFGRKYQNISTYKANNTGADLLKELYPLYYVGDLPLSTLTGIEKLTPPDISHNRYLFNKTHTFTFNNLKRLNNITDLSWNLVFYHQNEQNQRLQNTSYWLSKDSMWNLSERLSTSINTNHIEGELRYKKNEERYYFDNYFNLKGHWDTDSGDMTSNNNNTTRHLSQSFDNVNFEVLNALSIVKTKDAEHGVNIKSTNKLSVQPQHLCASPNLYQNIFNDSLPHNSINQNIGVNSFGSSNDFSLLLPWYVGRFMVRPTAKLNAEVRSLNSNISTTQLDGHVVELKDTAMNNNILYANLAASAGFAVKYAYQRLNFVLNLPIADNFTTISDHLQSNNSYSQNRIYFQPSFDGKYAVSGRWEISAQYNYGINPPTYSSLYPGYILTNYRVLNRYQTHIYNTYAHSGYFNLMYKDLAAMFFSGIGAEGNYYTNDAIFSQTIRDNLIVSQLKLQRNLGYHFAVDANVSKGFNWKSLVLAANASWGQDRNQLLRQNDLIDYVSHFLILNGVFRLQPMKGLSFSYNTKWRSEKGGLVNGESLPALFTMKNSMQLSAEIIKNLLLNTSFEHNYRSGEMNQKNFSFADMDLTYIHKEIRYSLNWTNMLNVSRFISSYYGTMGGYYSEYYLRPMAIMLKIQLKLK